MPTDLVIRPEWWGVGGRFVVGNNELSGIDPRRDLGDALKHERRPVRGCPTDAAIFSGGMVLWMSLCLSLAYWLAFGSRAVTPTADHDTRLGQDLHDSLRSLGYSLGGIGALVWLFVGPYEPRSPVWWGLLGLLAYFFVQYLLLRRRQSVRGSEFVLDSLTVIVFVWAGWKTQLFGGGQLGGDTTPVYVTLTAVAGLGSLSRAARNLRPHVLACPATVCGLFGMLNPCASENPLLRWGLVILLWALVFAYLPGTLYPSVTEEVENV